MKGAFQQFRISKPPPRNGRRTQQQSQSTGTSDPPSVSASQSTPDEFEESSRYSAQFACGRCRRLKKKCTRTAEGSCSLCLAAWLPCSFPKSIQKAQEREKAFQERISWLSRFVNEARPPNSVPVELIETGQDIITTSITPPIPTEQAPIASDSWTVYSHQQELLLGFGKTLKGYPKTINPPCLLDKATGTRLVDAYFRHVHRAYPFLDRHEMVRCMISCFLSATNDTILLEISRIPTRLAVVMAIGRTTLQRVNEIGNTLVPFFNIPEKEIIHDCLCKNDLASLEILTLLTLYSLFEPNSVPPGSITGILTRKVVSMGLIRDSGSSCEISQVELERRRRLFWSVYVLDRMISVSYGLPPGISDDDIAVPLPSITVDEYASSDRYSYAMTLQVNRHVVSLRRLEGRIMQKIHLLSSQRLAAMSSPISTSYYEDTRREIDDWYTQGCLMSSSAMNNTDHLPFHNTITWHNVRYQNLYVLLYSPSRFNVERSLDEIEELHSAARNDNKSRNYILPWESPNSTTGGESTLYGMANDVALCARVLESFSEDWGAAKRAAGVLQRFSGYVTEQQSTSFVETTPRADQGLQSLARHYDPVLDAVVGASVLDAPLNDRQLLPLQTIRREIQELIKDTLGETTIYSHAVKEFESTSRLMKTDDGPRLFPAEKYGATSLAVSDFPDPDASADKSGRITSSWPDFMDDLGFGVL
ncbi:conserved hypothetical protein [Talaromyces stipitatus ATCC 10500]|uniref:Zn(2)-C6 fungal-type domain-containing protein n=1 Tax=Talaromyces stipitatus (strain ATCC 10500 / CBS 375.48 / QM 6759 / NRRL 1006) TaxID=441959 RepID=B8M944_TALSN|nr:uncharacterized protein TSTA_111750 [Talaromyces stipitatus ATCC 10500]EED17339.1 conserved hypothetical protein [Talaromyces stipitatus ATCC 10500]